MFKFWEYFEAKNSPKCEPVIAHGDSIYSKEVCNRDKEIEELQRKLKASENSFNKLRAEVDQSYIKDAIETPSGNSIEYIDKLGKISVKVYEFNTKYAGHPWVCRVDTERTLKETWGTKQCIELRDFLVKNFPVESKTGIEITSEHIAIDGKSIDITGNTVFSGTEDDNV